LFFQIISDTINVTSQFKTRGNGYGRQNGEQLAVDPNNPDILFCGTRKDGLLKNTIGRRLGSVGTR